MTHYTETLPNHPPFHLHLIPGGVFDMGSRPGDPGAYEDEHPLREGVQVHPFYIGTHLVTQRLWAAVMDGDDPARFKGPNRPIESVSWFDCERFIEQLNVLTATARKAAGVGKYRFPTEAEWEYAARGGRRMYQYAGSDKLKEVGWYDENSNSQTWDVGLLLPNELGLFDMSGNVWEWCADHWHDNYNRAPADSRAWLTTEEKSLRVIRGGSSFDAAQDCRTACRARDAPVNAYGTLGLRLALSPSSEAGWPS